MYYAPSRKFESQSHKKSHSDGGFNSRVLFLRLAFYSEAVAMFNIIMKDAYYFPHDSNARHDPKIKSLINKYGIEGYGRYWIILEMLRESTGYKLEDKKYIWEALAENMKCDLKETKQFVTDCIEEFELFIQIDGLFYSNSLLLRMLKLDEIREKRRQAANERWNN